MTSWEVLLFIVVFGMMVFGLDDLFIDLWAWWKKAKPLELTPELEAEINDRPERPLAILVANWNEELVLESMIRGNRNAINYKNYQFFLGVYPNDEPTLAVAHRLAQTFTNVHCVVNLRFGPTSKGQMLNECLRFVLSFSENTKTAFSAILLHDSEDVIHPFSLKMTNYFLAGADFLQFPVFSFRLNQTEWVGGTYSDEFAEHHIKEMCLRSKVGRAVPSAGTGTALSMSLVQKIIAHEGKWMKEDCLTEDYHLGQVAHRLGFRALFLCYFRRLKNGSRFSSQKDWIATREYFPKRFRASLRQKSRWALGIVFQGGQQFGWQGDLLDRYFLWRDRRSGLNALVLTFALLISIIWISRSLAGFAPTNFERLFVFQLAVSFNLLNLSYRVFRRALAVTTVSGFDQCLGLPIRWPIANVINVLAPLKAYVDYRLAEKRGETPQWVKTAHELPREFGRTQPILTSAALDPGGPQ